MTEADATTSARGGLTASAPATYRRVMSPNAGTWQHPWLRVPVIIRELLRTRCGADMWPVAKVELGHALTLQSRPC